MKLTGNWLAMCGMVALFLASCFDPPQYGPIPEIEFDKIIFKDVSDPSSVDSLIISLKFKDGDGDLGLDASELIAPYNNKYYFKFSDNTFVTYKTKRTNPRYDTLPAFVKPYNCINWEIKTVNNKIDTFYFQLNPNHYNIFIDFFVQNNDGSFKEFDWQKEFTYPNCGIPFDGRFPLLSKDLSQKTKAQVQVGANIFTGKAIKRGVGSGTANQDIDTKPAGQHVVSRAALQNVVA